MNAYLRMFRMLNAVMGVVGCLVAAFIAAGVSGMADHWTSVLVMCVVVFLFVGGGNSLNDSIDYEIDKVSHPERPVPKGEISVENARKFGIGLLVACVVASFFTFDIWSIVLVAIAAVLMFAYETRLKQIGFAGNVTIAVLTGMVFLVGASVVGPWYENIYVCVMAAAVSVGREISKDIEDMAGDEGRNTLPMRIGAKNAATVALVFFLVGVVMSVIPIIQNSRSILYYVVLVADAFFVISAAKVHKDPHSAQRNAKKGMLFGLLAFILGAIYI